MNTSTITPDLTSTNRLQTSNKNTSLVQGVILSVHHKLVISKWVKK